MKMLYPPTGEKREVSEDPGAFVPLMLEGWRQCAAEPSPVQKAQVQLDQAQVAQSPEPTPITEGEK